MRGTVIQVTNGGRGFVIEAGTDRYVVTAAHCLPDFPEPFGAAGGNSSDRIYGNLLGQLGASLDVTAECVFLDLIADLAVFSEPDSQVYPDEACAYWELTGSAEAFPVRMLSFRQSRRGPPTATSEAMMLPLDGDWFSCRVVSQGRALWIGETAQPIESGMSGSPIILPDGSAVGVVCVSEEGKAVGMAGPNPMLSASLPAWLLGDVSPS